MEDAIVIKNLSVRLGGSVDALHSVTAKLPAGKIIGCIGPSGAGKTTLMRCIVGRLAYTTGEIRVFRKQAGSKSLRRDVAYMTQELSVYTDLTVEENLLFFASMAGVSRRERAVQIKDILATVSLEDKIKSLVGNLSGGQKQRVSMAVALLGAPKLLVLDEPTVGLDPVLRNSLWHVFHRLVKEGKTIVVTSHSMDEASRCDDIVLLREGSVIAHSSPKILLERTKTKTVEQAFLSLVGGAL